jgi:deoxycytidylate deaminase
MMINARVKKVVYMQSYPDQTALDFLQLAGIEVQRLNEKNSCV